MNLGLAGRAALVTGASSGLGLAVARGLAAEGASVVMCARSRERLEAASAEVREVTGSPTLAVPADVKDPEAAQALVEATLDAFGRLDVLVTNAGGPPAGRRGDLQPDQYADAMDLAFHSVVRLVYAAVSPMITAGWGRVIAITSVSAKQPIPGLTLSNVTRPAVVGFIKSISSELASKGVLCNAVAPGYTATPPVEAWLAESAPDVASGESVRSTLLRQIPVGRLARPGELADAVVFLASERASYLSGTTLPVDGGYVRSLL